MVDMFLNTDLVEYFTLAQSINELIETGHLAVDEEQGVVVLTRLGYEASDALYRSLPSGMQWNALKGAGLTGAAGAQGRHLDKDGGTGREIHCAVHVDGSRRRAVENGIVHAVL